MLEHYQLVPDQARQVLTSGYQSGSSYAAAARALDGSTVIAYIPNPRAVTVDLSKLSGSTAKAWWFDPRSGTATMINTFSTSGPTTFTPPDQNDWVLVIDDATLNLQAPGTLGAPAAPTGVRVIR